jgi:uncharacterized protein (UPF0216 family)
MMIKQERNLYTVPTLFKKEFKIIEKFKWKLEYLTFKNLSRKLLTTSKLKNRKKKTCKHLLNLYKPQIQIDGVKFKE